MSPRVTGNPEEPSQEYDAECKKLIGQFRVVHEAVRDKVASIRQFAQQHGLSADLGIKRLEKGMSAVQASGQGALQSPRSALP